MHIPHWSLLIALRSVNYRVHLNPPYILELLWNDLTFYHITYTKNCCYIMPQLAKCCLIAARCSEIMPVKIESSLFSAVSQHVLQK